MTDSVEVQQELIATQENETQVESSNVTTNIDPYEEEARSQGWKPLEEYEGDKSKWRSSKEFVERGELFGKIDTLGKELKDTRKALKMLQEHHTKVKETEFKRAVDELKGLQKRHLEEGNSDAYLETTELLTDLKAEQKAREVVQQNTPNAPDPRFIQWVDNNQWYKKDADMREYADFIGQRYANSNPDLDPEEVLVYVTKQVKTQFKDKFVNPNRAKPSAVEGASSTPSNKSSFELSDDERRVMNTFIRSGVMSKDDYIAELKKMRGVK